MIERTAFPPHVGQLVAALDLGRKLRLRPTGDRAGEARFGL